MTRRLIIRLGVLRLAVLAAALLVDPRPGAAVEPTPPLLVVLADTGLTCAEGLPRLTRHPNAPRYSEVLRRGFSGKLLRLYRHVQLFRHHTSGVPVEPAYLFLSRTQGGFPRFGFCLDGEEKPGVGYVNLHRSQKLSGSFGAMDQIFPHELLHVISRQLAGAPPEGGSNQVHAVGVRTDRYQAFNEGFAEHAQVMALEDADAVDDTAALVRDHSHRDLAWRNLAAYQRALTATWALAPRHRMGFVFWFSSTEQVLRYHAVKINLFAHEAGLPPSLLTTADPWAAYLLENILPGEPGAPRKSSSRLAATEGVVAAALARWVSLPVAQERREEPVFYEPFGARVDSVSPLENAYLKLFRVLADEKTHDIAGLARAYTVRYPDEAPAVAAVLAEIGITLDRPAPEIWLATERFQTGTTLFDQYRGLPRAHTFDLNAASPADLACVRDLGAGIARAVRDGVPYETLEDLGKVPGIPQAVVDEIRRMQAAFKALQAQSAESEASLSLWAVFWPTIWRAAFWMAVAAASGAVFYRLLRRLSLGRLAWNGIGAATLGLAAAWTLDAPWWFAPAVPLALFGLPAVLWQVRRQRWAEGLRVAGAWVLTVLPTIVITRPIG